MPRQRHRQADLKHGVIKFSHDGPPSVFTCPDCSGTLFIVKHGELVRFRCRVGHMYSPESMLEAQADNVERSLWAAARALEEQSEYGQQMARQLAKLDDHNDGSRYRRQARTAMQNSKAVRKVIEKNARIMS